MQIIDNVVYYTRPEAAEKIGVPPATLDYWAHKKIGPAIYKPGKIALYSEESIAAFKASRTTGGES